MKWLAIVNRRSGRERSAVQFQPILDRVQDLVSDIVFTEYSGHARTLAAQATAFDGIVVVGGDGTLLEVLNGLGSLRQRLAIVPTGRGNSLARDLGVFPLNSSFEAIHSGRWCRVDLLEATFENNVGRQFRSLCASTVALGYPAALVRAAGARFRRFGVYCYAAATVSLRPVTEKIRIAAGDRTPVEKRLTGFVANNTRHLANFLALPHACCHDGHFDVMEMHSGFFRQSMHNLSALSGLQIYNPSTLTPMTRVALTLNDPQELMLDGELYRDVISLQVGIRESAVDFTQGKLD